MTVAPEGLGHLRFARRDGAAWFDAYFERMKLFVRIDRVGRFSA